MNGRGGGFRHWTNSIIERGDGIWNWMNSINDRRGRIWDWLNSVNEGGGRVWVQMHSSNGRESFSSLFFLLFSVLKSLFTRHTYIQYNGQIHVKPENQF